MHGVYIRSLDDLISLKLHSHIDIELPRKRTIYVDKKKEQGRTKKFENDDYVQLRINEEEIYLYVYLNDSNGHKSFEFRQDKTVTFSVDPYWGEGITTSFTLSPEVIEEVCNYYNSFILDYKETIKQRLLEDEYFNEKKEEHKQKVLQVLEDYGKPSGVTLCIHV